MIRFYKSPWILRLLFPSLVWRIESDDSMYLTFDDGPDPEITPWVISELKKIDAKATFFCVGENLERNPDVIEKLLSNGHRIANHTNNHLNGWTTSTGRYMEEVEQCDKKLAKLGGDKALFRPPYGKITSSQIRLLKHKRIIMWSHLSWDFNQKINPDQSIKKLKKAKPGSILVFHDSQKAFSNLQKILPEILDYFHREGIKFKAIT